MTSPFVAPPASLGTLLLPEMKVVSAENSRQLEKRFAFLWSSAHRLLPTSAALANQMIAVMMQLARSSRAQLPQSVVDFICESCGGLLVPSVSADVRVVPQPRKSRANRRLARQQRRAQLQNGSNGPRLVREALSTIVRVACHRCKHVNNRPGSSVVHKAKTKKRTREGKETNTDAVAVAAPDAKRLKVESGEAAEIERPKVMVGSMAAAVDSVEGKVAPTSVFAPPPSPPRKLLDGPKKKKKKKKAQPDAAVVAVKSSLSSFLEGLNSRK